MAALSGIEGPDAAGFRYRYEKEMATAARPDEAQDWTTYSQLGRTAIAAERDKLDDLRDRHGLSQETFYELQEGLDWRELSLAL